MALHPSDPAAELTASATTPADALPSTGVAASPPATRRLLPSMLVAGLTLFATYAGLIAILLPTQVQVLFGQANQEANLAIVTTTSFAFTLFAQPLAGSMLFVFAIVFVVLAAVATAPIKGVR